MVTEPGQQAEAVAAVIERSDERAGWLRRVMASWQEGFRLGELAHADDYQRGLCDGALARKRAEHDLVAMVRLDVARWGPLGREHYGDPRPGDYMGGPVDWNSRGAA